MPLKLIFQDALNNQEDDLLNAQVMLDILQEFATEADHAEIPAVGAAAGEPASVVLPAVAAANDQPAPPQPISVGDIVLGRATKFKEKFNNVHGKVITVLSTHYKVELLEGAAKGETHKYIKNCVRLVPPKPSIIADVQAAEARTDRIAATVEKPPEPDRETDLFGGLFEDGF